MSNLQAIQSETSIMTMSHETIGQMDRYEDVCIKCAGNVDSGSMTIKEAISSVRRYG